MTIEHLAIWAGDLENLKDFYCRYFHAIAGEKYSNPAKQFESYFLTFEKGARLELMHMPDLAARPTPAGPIFPGFIHLALSVGGKEEVDSLTRQLELAGIALVDGPRWTGDGYYESVVLDPEGNRIEITI